MKKIAAVLVTLGALCVSVVNVRPAHACASAINDDRDGVQTLKAAEIALGEGDVGEARKDAESAMRSGEAAEQPTFAKRAARVYALSFIRDPDASKSEIDAATEKLRAQVAAETTSVPSLEADLGEGYARAGDDDAAYRTLAPLAKKDLIGSPYAYAALQRIAKKRGDAEMATTSATRCADMTTSASICRGEYPSPRLASIRKLLHSDAAFALPIVPAGALVGLLALARRRRTKS